MNEQELLDWLAVQVDSEPIKDQDLLNGFVLLQLISLISPSSVDLTWYTTPEAWDCPNISLRNYVTLSKGIKYLAANLPDKLTTAFSSNKNLLKDKMEHFHSSIKKLSETVLQNAKAGELEACKQILVELYTIWKITQVDETVLLKPTTPIRAEKEDDYIPTERTFRPMIQWMLQKLKYLLDKTSVSKSVIQVLCDCELYNLLNKLMFQSKETKSLENNLEFKSDTFSAFLDNLVKKGFLNIKASLLQSIKDMIRDQTPFYESVHINIIAAFMSADIRSIDLDPFVKYLSQNFSSFDSSNEQWKSLVGDISEFDDLAQDLENGWMMCALIAGYYPEKCKENYKKISVGTELSKNKVEKNYRLLQELVEVTSKDLVVPWKPVDITFSMDNQNVSSGNISYLFVSFLARFMTIVQKKNLVYLANKTAIKELKAERRRAAELKKIEQENEDLVEIHVSGEKNNAKDDASVVEPVVVATLDGKVNSIQSAISNLDSPQVLEETLSVDSLEPTFFITNNDSTLAPNTGKIDIAPKEDSPIEAPVSEKKKKGSRSKKSKENETACVSTDIAIPITDVISAEKIKEPPSEENTLEISQDSLPIVKPKSRKKSSSGKSKRSIKSASEKVESPCISNPLLMATEQIMESIDMEQNIKEPKKSKRSSQSGKKSRRAETLTGGEEISKLSTTGILDCEDPNNDIPTSFNQELESHSSGIDYENVETVQKLSTEDNTLPEDLADNSDLPIKKRESKKRVKSSKKSSRKQKLAPVEILDETPMLGSSPTGNIESDFESTSKLDQDKLSLPALVVPRAAEKINPKKFQVEHLPNIFDSQVERTCVGPDMTETPNERLQMDNEDTFHSGFDHLKDIPDPIPQPNEISDVEKGKYKVNCTTSDESDDEMDEETWNMILKIRNSSEKLIEESGKIASRQSSGNSNDKKTTKEPQFEKIQFQDTIVDSDDDFSFIPSNRGGTAMAAEESHQKLKPISRPRTGLQTYPLPESDDEKNQASNLDLNDSKGEESWQRVQKMKRLAKLTPKSKSEKQKKLSANAESESKAKLTSLPKEELKLSPAKSKQEKEEEIAKKKLEQVKLQEQIISEKLKKRSEKLIESARQTPKPPKPTSSKFRKSLSTKSNKNLIKNALMHVCLAGNLNKGVKEEVLQDLTESEANHFVILLRDVNNFAFRGLYFWDPNLDQTLKLYSGSPGPTELDPAGVLEFYKYDSGARTFKPIPTKSFGRTVDAIAIGRDYFVPNK
ncbi:hypothetical protein HDV04_002075 [Boothiomyces sp. JEL0838]|nr:hypothetical protein HDV04_002075 [Boothiomyces sp. JEL0838]